MENCRYQQTTLCTFDLKDENGFYYEDKVLQWKQAAADHKLTCPECGANVYLAAGPVKEPYFAHYDLVECTYGNGHETEELKKGKRLLYQLLKRSFPDSSVQARYRMENGLYSTLYCKPEGENAIAVDYRLQNSSLENFRLRDTFYQVYQIIPLYVCSIRQEKDTTQIDWYQSLIQNAMGYLIFLDVQKEALTLKKSFSYRLGKERHFKYCIRTYPIKELFLSRDGTMICDFTQECKKIEQFILDEKEHYKKKEEQLSKLKEHYRRMEEMEEDRLSQYRILREKEEERVPGQESLIPMQPFHLEGDEQNHHNSMESQELDPKLLEKCRKMIEEGNGHLVSRKYYDAIMGISLKHPN